MNLGHRIMLAVVVMVTTTFAFAVALALSFALAPLGFLVGAAVVGIAPLLAVRAFRVLNQGFRSVLAEPIVFSVWVALFVAFGILQLMSVSVTQGDAFNAPWMIGILVAIAMGTVVGVTRESRWQKAQ